MKYPAIVKSISSNIFLCANKIDHYDFHLDEWRKWSDTIGLKNIAAEYLANTYGEVKSKAHAEFIVKLAENHGYKLKGSFHDGEDCSFAVLSDTGVIFFSSASSHKNLKQIIIPLPPECDSEDEWPKVGDDVVLMSGKGNVVALPDNHGNYVIVTEKGFYLLANKDDIKKPKTPEQIMQENLINIYESSLDGGHFVDNLLSEYALTKKPQ